MCMVIVRCKECRKELLVVNYHACSCKRDASFSLGTCDPCVEKIKETEFDNGRADVFENPPEDPRMDGRD